MIRIKDYSEYIVLILEIILIMFCLFLVINKFNECKNKGGTYIQGRCVKKEVLVDDKN